MNLSRRDFLQGWFQTAPQVSTDPIHHLLNRLTWGPRPEEIERARQLGIAAFVDEQLHPERIDDSVVETKLQQIPILFMDRRTLYSLMNFEERVYRALIEGMITRAVFSRRQLLERIVEFWSDHFNIPTGEGDNTPDLVLFQRDTIRRHALGNFRDLLIATAKSPAMLVYLDNFVNIAGHPNENYARELLELHTLGVDGGYTETDVKEVARAFTGWTIHNKTATGFYFNEEDHDKGSKTVLGHRLPSGRGIEDGLHVLSLLANHPTTAQFISHKLCIRFVSDTPPQSLVDELTQVWLASDGDIKQILNHLFLSPAFQAATGQKLRRPLDFFIGALRATGTQISADWRGQEFLEQLGQVPYGWQPPNGYPDVASAWMSTNGLLARWNIAMALTHEAYSEPYQQELSTPIRERIGEPTTVADLVDAVALQVFGVSLTGSDRAKFIDYTADGGQGTTAVTPHLIARKLGSLYGLMLASPQYQWR